MRASLLGILIALVASCGDRAAPDPPAPRPAPRLPAGRHWGHQTLADLLATDAMFEARQPILGVGYPTALQAIGGVEPSLDCATTTTNSSCRETTREALYVPGFTDDHPLEVRVDPRRGPGQTITAYTVTISGRDAAPDAVLAAMRARLGAPTQIDAALTWTWIRGGRATTARARSADETSVEVTIRAVAPDAPPAAVPAAPACQAAIAAFDAYERCARVPLRERDLHADVMDLAPAWPAGECATRAAELQASAAAAGCAAR